MNANSHWHWESLAIPEWIIEWKFILDGAWVLKAGFGKTRLGGILI